VRSSSDLCTGDNSAISWDEAARLPALPQIVSPGTRDSIGRLQVEDPRDEFIRRVVAGKTFIDVGGLSEVIYERVSIAAEAGAATVTMMDVEAPQCRWWNELRQRLEERGVTKCEFISGDIFNTELEPREIVHSSGVLYHLPSPIEYLAKLRRITKEYCILTSTTLSTRLETPSGKLSLPSSSVLFIPALGGEEGQIVREWFARANRGDVTESEARFGGWRNLTNYYPNWFIPTVAAFKEMAHCGGFDIVEDAPVEPNDYSYCLLLRPT
jgi:hypothetical protein